MIIHSPEFSSVYPAISTDDHRAKGAFRKHL